MRDFEHVPNPWPNLFQLHVEQLSISINLSVKELLSWDELGAEDAAVLAVVSVSFLDIWLLPTFCPAVCVATRFSCFQSRRRCFRTGEAPVALDEAVFLVFLRGFDAFAFWGGSGTGTAVRTTSPWDDCDTSAFCAEQVLVDWKQMKVKCKIRTDYEGMFSLNIYKKISLTIY